MDSLDGMRLQFPVCQSWTYLNHAAVSPLPLCCTERIQAYLHELGRNGAVGYPRPVVEALARVRQQGAALLSVRPDQIFVVRSTTQGLGLVVTGLPWRAGDNVVLVDREFPANQRPWMPLKRRGVEVRMVPQRDGRVEVADLRAAVDGHTRVVSVSFVQFLSGFRIDPAAVAEICRAHDALFVLDAIQGLGAFELDAAAAGVDFLSADAHKWLLGPEGVGLGFCSDRALERIQPALEGWLAVVDPFDFFDLDQPLKPDAGRFEEGAYNTAGLHGLAGSLELLLGVGVDRISQRILSLTDRLAEGLSASGWRLLSPRARAGEKSGIVSATRDDLEPDGLQRRLTEAGFVVSIRGGALRVAPHAYNTPDEIDALLGAL